ncbi:MAG: hypothetical protein KC933_25635, partial [Myxococcales bacterium]|nr:hypothetical protein [Myxococcales bacterium]
MVAHSPPQHAIEAALAEWRSRLARRLIRVASVVMVPPTLSFLVQLLRPGVNISVPLTLTYCITLALVLVLAWHPRVS